LNPELGEPGSIQSTDERGESEKEDTFETGAMGFLFGEAEVAAVNEKNCFEVELEDEEFRTEETYSGVKELERTQIL
jgi:hypothetical protein